MFLVAFLYMIIASTFTIGKLGLQYLQPIFFIAARMLVGGSLLLGYLYVFKRSLLKFKKEHLWLFASVILFHIFFAFVAEFWALQYLSSSKVCLFYNLSPFISAIFSYFWFAEIMTAKKFIGLLIGFLGFFPILFFGSEYDLAQGGFLFFSWPEVAMLFSVTCASFGWIVVRKLGRQGYSILAINGIGMFVGGVLALLTSLLVEGVPKVNSVSGIALQDFATSVGYVFLLVFLANVLFYNLYGILLQRYTATFLSFAGFLTPLFAAIFGWIFVGESVSWSFFLTIIFVLFGLYIFYQEELRQGYMAR